MSKILFSILALAIASPVFAGEGDDLTQSEWQEARDQYAKVPGFERSEKMQSKFDLLKTQHAAYAPSGAVLKTHPYVRPDYKGPTVASAVDGSYRDIEKYKAGMAEFTAEVEALEKASKAAGDADAPNKFLVAQGWKIVKAMANAFNNNVVPASQKLFQASTKGNQNLEILIAIAGNSSQAPNPAKLAALTNEEALIEMVQTQKTANELMRKGAGPLLSKAQSEVGPIYDMILVYDKKYTEYNRGVSKMQSGAGRLAKATLQGLSQAVTTAQVADSRLEQADTAEQQAINAVRECIKGRKQAATTGQPGDQARAESLNNTAKAKVKEADGARQNANAIIERPVMARSIPVDSHDRTAAEVDYRESDKISAGAANRAAGSAQRMKGEAAAAQKASDPNQKVK